MRPLSSLILLGFVGMAVFGFIPLGTHYGHAMEGCLAALTTNTVCPIGSDPVASAAHYIGGYSAFSFAVMMTFLFALAFIVLFILDPESVNVAASVQFLGIDAASRDDSIRQKLKEYLRWLFLHTNSPSR
jgi:hypothetical protein